MQQIFLIVQENHKIAVRDEALNTNEVVVGVDSSLAVKGNGGWYFPEGLEILVMSARLNEISTFPFLTTGISDLSSRVLGKEIGLCRQVGHATVAVPKMKAVLMGEVVAV